mmetsp:Transcript_41615/g.81840  ORF Transcript_41615/g.81840 Transcript_41615/m.81840 type:complete len:92 (+) Transcript_41615:438-713(+)
MCTYILNQMFTCSRCLTLTVKLSILQVPGGAYGTGEPGDFGFGASFLKGKSDAQVTDLKLKEIVHGRLAMWAIAGMVTQTLCFGVGGSTII